MEGPQFSTLAESKLYRSWGMDVIGMTNLQEAKLAREAEICYATLALVTDYDCWHPDHDSVTVDLIIANLMQNAATAQKTIAEAVSRLGGPRTCACKDALATAIITRPEHVPEQTKKELAPIIGKYMTVGLDEPSEPGRARPAESSATMKIVVTGSIAYDYLMSFPGKFTEHFLPEHMHRVSLSFLVDTMDKRRGGCAPNIAYTLALLGERPVLMATAGEDFGEYREWLEAAGVDTSHVKQVAGKFTASFFCSTDQAQQPDCVVLHRRDGRRRRAVVPDAARDCDLAIISPNDPGAMVQYAEECRALGIRYIFDPGQQCARMSGDELAEGVVGATIVICNDYEFELLRQKTGLGEAEILEHSEALIVTRGEHGSSVYARARPGGRAGRRHRGGSSIRPASATRFAAG